MKLVLTIVVAVLAAFAGRALAPAASAAPEAGAENSGGGESTELRAALFELRAQNQRLAQEIERREHTLVAAQAPADELGEAEIAAALARWEAAHPAGEESAAVAEAQRAAPLASGEIDLAKVPMDELVRALSGSGFGNAERQEIFQKLRDNGRIDEYVAAIEKLAQENPNDPDIQVALGHAYLQKLFGVGNSPETGPLAMKSDAAFDRALELDDHNWSARFSKAVSLSNWPAFLGRGPEAIENFELLIEQQSEQPKRPEFAMTFLFLGNMQQAAGDHDKALATWRSGLSQFPEMTQLQEAIALAESQGQDGARSANR